MELSGLIGEMHRYRLVAVLRSKTMEEALVLDLSSHPRWSWS